MTSRAQKAYVTGLQEVLAAMGPAAAQYLERLQRSSLPIKRTLQHLADLKDRFGNQALLDAMRAAIDKDLVGAEYVEQLLLQLSCPPQQIPRLEIANHPELSRLRLSEVDLALYDTVLLSRRGDDHDDET
jgi:hypothetical protein